MTFRHALRRAPLTLIALAALSLAALSGCSDSSTPPAATSSATVAAATAPLTAFDLTNDNWTKGISVTGPQARFVLANGTADALAFEVGDEVVFAKSGSRKITEVLKAKRFTEITVDGAVLDPDADGFPAGIGHGAKGG